MEKEKNLEIYCYNRKYTILVQDVYKDYEYAIITTGYYPLAYVKPHKYNDFSWYDENIDCHFGITFHGKHPLLSKNDNDEWIGWDYGHCCDYIAYNEDDDHYCSPNAKKWTISEIKDEIKNVIEQLISKE